MTIFDQYATYYDLFYGAKDYRSETDYVLANIRRYRDESAQVLELGCGTGAHAAELARRGFSVTGVDISEQMLERARNRVTALPAGCCDRLELRQGDARAIRLQRSFGIVMSLFHVMSYQSSTADLIAAFESIAVHLEPGGIVAFDFWYGPGVLMLRPETRVQELENSQVRITRISRPELKENENCVNVNLTVLIEDKRTLAVKRVEEMHKMRYLFLPEIDYFLEKFGMRRLCAKGWMSDGEPDKTCWAGFVVGEKAF